MVVQQIEDLPMVVQFHPGRDGLLGEWLTHLTVYEGITGSNPVQIASVPNLIWLRGLKQGTFRSCPRNGTVGSNPTVRASTVYAPIAQTDRVTAF